MNFLIGIVALIHFSIIPNWGFYAHKRINKQAIFLLPSEMRNFYEEYVEFITEQSVLPDKRRYINPQEGSRHFIDLDIYGDSAIYKMPRFWKHAVAKYGEDSLNEFGTVPWHINLVRHWLTNAFVNKDANQILRLSADLGHYIADAHVPLHTTVNYNGQLTEQQGIHGLWESRLPELYTDGYDFFIGKAEYIENPQIRIWQTIKESHLAVDSVLRIEQNLTEEMGESKKYVIEQRGNSNIRNFSEIFSKVYHERLSGMVERRMRASIKTIADFWYTAWIDGGQPRLSELEFNKKHKKNEKLLQKTKHRFRNHEAGKIIDQ